MGRGRLAAFGQLTHETLMEGAVTREAADQRAQHVIGQRLVRGQHPLGELDDTLTPLATHLDHPALEVRALGQGELLDQVATIQGENLPQGGDGGRRQQQAVELVEIKLPVLRQRERDGLARHRQQVVGLFAETLTQTVQGVAKVGPSGGQPLIRPEQLRQPGTGDGLIMQQQMQK